MRYFRLIKICFWTANVTLCLTIFACKKIVEVNPPANFVISESAFASNQTAISELNSIYYSISAEEVGRYTFLNYIQGISASAGLSADEFDFLASGFFPVNSENHQNKLTSATMPASLWDGPYLYIFRLNSILEGLGKATSTDEDTKSMLSPNVKRQLLGEAKFMRALIYFYLVNSFGDVPLVVTTDYKVNSILARTDKKMVYQQMEKDLLEARDLLADKYVNPDVITSNATSERTRPIKWAATALLARVYLYMEKYSAAENESSAVISNSSLYSLVDLDNVFLKNSKETIFALQPVVEGYHSSFGRHFVLPSAGPTSDAENNSLFLNEELVNSFEMSDPRKVKWINSVNTSTKVYYYPFKYKKGDIYNSMINKASKTMYIEEFNMVLRLGEQYLIRADARAKQGNISGAIADLNLIRDRARIGYPATVLPSLDASQYNSNSIALAIENERRHELFTEWGDRWFNLRRTGRLNEVMEIATPKKGGGDWNPDQAIYPLPMQTLLENPVLKQNKGY